MPYSYITLSAAEDLLSGTLGDLQGSVSKVRWASTELRLNLFEALRAWSSFTGMWEERTTPIAIAAGTSDSPWVDIPAVTPLRAYTLTDRSLIGQIQYHFWELYDPIDGTGMTDMWTFARIVEAMQRRRDQFLFDTKCRLVRTVLPTPPAIIGPYLESYTLPGSVISVERAAWADPYTGNTSYLGEISDWTARNGRAQILGASSVPRSYVLSNIPFELEPIPVPSNSGRLDLIVAESGADLDPATGVLLGIPDDFAWAIKWGAMADLLAEDGAGRDYSRALFCERRYRMGVVAALTNGPLIGARINGRPVQLSRLEQLDAARPNWQAKTGTPTVLGWAGMNLLAIADPPRADIQLELDLQRNAPIPFDGSDYLQVGKEHLDLILGYASHLSMFKVGGTEFAASTHLADNFFEAASEINVRLKESAAFQDLRFGRQKEEVATRGLRRVTGNSVNEDQSGYK